MPCRTAFISGPLDPSPEYFQTHYAPRLDAAIASGDSFVLGPMPGIDALSLDHLLAQGVPASKITIHMAEFEYNNEPVRRRFEESGVGIRCEGQTTRQRDKSMTEASDYDILRYRTEAEAKELYGEAWWPRVSSTEMNERRRRGDTSERYVGAEVEHSEGGKGERWGRVRKFFGRQRKDEKDKLKD